MISLDSFSRALVFSLLGFTIFTVADSFTKLLGEAQLPVSQIIAFSSLFCVLTIGGMAWARRRVHALRPKRYKLELLRAVLYTSASIVNVIAFTHLSLTTVYIGLFTCPMIVALLASLFLGETLSWRQWMAIVVGFGGVVLAFVPTWEETLASNIVGFSALILFPILTSLNAVFVRYLGPTETSESLAFFPLVMRVLFVLPFCVLNYHPMTIAHLGTLAAMGFCMGVGLLLITSAIKVAPAGVVYLFQYTQIVSGALIGYLVWHSAPSSTRLAGAAVITLAGLYMARSSKYARVARPIAEVARET